MYTLQSIRKGDKVLTKHLPPEPSKKDIERALNRQLKSGIDPERITQFIVSIGDYDFIYSYSYEWNSITQTQS
jgi:hypothetical protein